MEEEKIDQELPAPPRFRNTFFKIATLTLLFLVLFFTIGFVGLETSSSSEFCSSCHEMKPEYYTWKASSHGEVDCVNCHIEPGVENLAKAKANGLVELYKKQTQTYTAPIRMPKDIPDKSCERCHNVFTREVTPSGDLIIPHDKHKNEGIECIQCHSGVAHAKIADRKMTYQVDYVRWDDKVGQAAMEDIKWTKPDMDTCMECHKARKVTTECKACHTSGMLPKSHKQEGFVSKGSHGIQARDKLNDCNECHKDMSKKSLEGFGDVPILAQYLKQPTKQSVKKSHFDYSKENTFCSDCHVKRPPSHSDSYSNEHGAEAKENKQKCLACHNLNDKSDTNANPVTCASCHPSSHNRNKEWRQRHPIPVGLNEKIQKSCYRCHNETTCSSCHSVKD